jgi:hypothetical protein
MAKIQTQHTFFGVHRWEDCPLNTVSFLRYVHHHDFTIVAECDVSHQDREVEFLMVRMEIIRAVNQLWPKIDDIIIDFGTDSCEHISERIEKRLAEKFHRSFKVSVYEDNISRGGQW